MIKYYIKNLSFIGFFLTGLLLIISSDVFYLLQILFLFSSFILTSYYVLYTNLSLQTSLISFLAFFFNIVIFVLYCKTMLFLYTGIKKPIYIESLSVFSQYRYLFLCLIVLLGALIYCLSFFYPQIVKENASYYEHLTYPYLKEEIYKILVAWDHPFFIRYCQWLTQHLRVSIKFKYFYLMLDFIIFFFTRIVLLIFFINFAFFQGDLYLVLYYMPIMFIVWLLNFVAYFYSNIFKDNLNVLCNCLQVSLKSNANITIEDNIIKGSENDFVFKITAYGISKGYMDDDYPFLVSLWFEFAQLQASFLTYRKYMSYISKVLFFFTACCWFKITSIHTSSFFEMGWGGGFFRATGAKMARASGYIPEPHKNAISLLTKGKVSPGHLVVGEKNPDGTYTIEGALTSGIGGVNDNKPENLHETKNVNGQPKVQNFIPINPSVKVPGHMVSPNPLEDLSFFNDLTVTERLQKLALKQSLLLKEQNDA